MRTKEGIRPTCNKIHMSFGAVQRAEVALQVTAEYFYGILFKYQTYDLFTSLLVLPGDARWHYRYVLIISMAYCLSIRLTHNVTHLSFSATWCGKVALQECVDFLYDVLFEYQTNS